MLILHLLVLSLRPFDCYKKYESLPSVLNSLSCLNHNQIMTGCVHIGNLKQFRFILAVKGGSPCILLAIGEADAGKASGSILSPSLTVHPVCTFWSHCVQVTTPPLPPHTHLSDYFQFDISYKQLEQICESSVMYTFFHLQLPFC